MSRIELPIPPHFDPGRVDQVWKVLYQECADDARKWAKKHKIQPASKDKFRIALLLVDVQNTFCIPGFELYVGGHSGIAAVDDNRRLCEFIYRNLDMLNQICPTLDTHHAMQIFHSLFLVNDKGEYPAPFTLIRIEDIDNGVWQFNPDIAESLKITPEYGQKFLHHYTQKLKAGGNYDLTVWPYHAMMGGIGHALVSAVEEAVFFHSIARFSLPDFQIKGGNALTENYSVIKPEVMADSDGSQIAERNAKFIETLLEFDAVFIAGQAKSHCVAWTIDDLLSEMAVTDSNLAKKVYLLEDCTSPVVIPDVIDYTDLANEAFQRFADAGMHVIRSTDPLQSLPGISF
jgi:nicotinamidase-related amidase